MPRSPSTINTAKRSTLGGNILPVFLSLVGTIIALYPNNPNNVTLPSRDSGVFLYIGWRILKGDVPYRDIWDHKPPLIYFIDALGLSLTPESLWGIWVIEFLFIFLTVFLIYKSMDRELGGLPAAAGVIILTSGLLTIIERGNVTEEYALVFQALCIYLLSKAKEEGFPRGRIFWIGLCGGISFFFKQTTIGLWTAFLIVLFLLRAREKARLGLDLIYLAAGWSIPIVLSVLYFQSNGALGDFWDQAFAYNILYIGKHEGLRRLVPVFIKGFAFLRQGWVLYVPMAGWLAGFIHLWIVRNDQLVKKHLFILFSVIALPIEVFFILISGRSILHYYLTPLPAMALLGAILVHILADWAGKLSSHRSVKGNAPALLLIIALILAQIPKARGYLSYMNQLSSFSAAEMVEYITMNTYESDKVLFIGAESAVNFLARREAPTRYVYQYPLALTGKRLMFEEYFHQILENRPVLIIDTRGKTELTDKLYLPLQKRSDVVRDGVEYLGENYEYTAQFGEWFVYRLKEDQ